MPKTQTFYHLKLIRCKKGMKKMSILKKTELMEKLKTIIGDKNDDETLAFIEDVSDTFDDKNKGTTSDEDWQKKYDELDNKWREKYKERFFNKSGNEEDIKEDEKLIDESTEGEEKKPLTFDNLFKTEEG